MLGEWSTVGDIRVIVLGNVRVDFPGEGEDNVLELSGLSK